MAKATQKPKIGISLCLLGYRVRYDGRSKFDRALFKALQRDVELVGICPEMECGLGVPREPIRLEGDPEEPRLLTVSSRKNLTAVMNRTAVRLTGDLCKAKIRGFIFKSKSPSCGLHDTPVHGAGMVGAGSFARAVAKAFPGLPVADEVALKSPKVRKDFLESARRYRILQGSSG